MNPGISVGHIYSLRGLLLGYNLAFLLLVIITGALGWTGVELRQQIADEADRVSTLLNLAQETRGDVYQQMTEVFDHHFLAEPLAVLRYRSTSQRIEARFLRLDQTALHPVEKEAIEAMLLAYVQVRLQTDEIMSVPSNAIREEGHLTVFFTADLEMAWLDSYEHVFAANDSLMRLTQRGEDEAESALSQNTRMILFLPVALAALMLLASRAFLNRALVRPVAEILRGAGADVSNFDLPALFTDIIPDAAVINAWEAAAMLTTEIRDHYESFNDHNRERIEWVKGLTEEDYRNAGKKMNGARAEMDKLFDNWDLILSPSLSGEPPIGLEEVRTATFARLWTQMYTPSVNFPIFEGPSGMPLCFQMVGRRDTDDATLGHAKWADEQLRSVLGPIPSGL